MAWTPHFRGLGYKKRAEFLHNYLRQRPDGLEQRSITDPFTHGYKNVFSFIVGSLSVRSEYRYISKNAREQFEKAKEQLKKENPLKKNIDDELVYNHVYNKKGHPEYKGLTNEHTIPVSVIVEHLAKLPKGQLTVDFLEDFIEKVSGIAVITSEENEKLNKIARDKLPDGTTLDDILNDENLHSARYKEAGIEMEVPNHHAKP